MSDLGAERCNDFGWQPQGDIDPALVTETLLHPHFGLGRAWSRTSTYNLNGDPRFTYLVYTVEGKLEFSLDDVAVHTEPGTLILLDGESAVTATTLAETARFIWYFEPTFLRPDRSRFRYHEPIHVSGTSVNALLSMTNAILNGIPPHSETVLRHIGMSLEHLVAGMLDEGKGYQLDNDSQHRGGPFMTAQAVIEAHFRDPAFDVNRLARELTTSIRTTHDLFSRFDTTPRREIERRRTEEAMRLKETAKMPVVELAERAGFSSPKHLRRALTRANMQSQEVLGAPPDHR